MFDPGKIFERPKDQRYWVVRASGGNFISHFRQESVIAIGHLDSLSLSSKGNDDSFVPKYKALRIALEAQEENEGTKGSKRRAHVHFNQVKSFVSEITIGDIVVSVDHGKLMIGRVIGNAYLDTNPVRYVYDEERNKYTEMSFQLRRIVQWGPLIVRSNLPTAMKRSISSMLTVFNIDKYWTTIYHFLYPVFRFEDKVYFSARIKQKEEINSLHVGQLFQILTELEVVTLAADRIIENPNISFKQLFSEYKNAGEYSLKTTAEFMSPGSVWSHLGFSEKARRRIVIGALLYGLFFGVDIMAIKVDGIIDREARMKLLEYFLRRLEENNTHQMIERLQLDVPRHNTKPLEDRSNDAKQDDRALASLEFYEDSMRSRNSRA